MFSVRSQVVQNLVPVCTCRFSINLWKDTRADYLLHIGVRINHYGTLYTLVTYKINDVFQAGTELRAPDNPFPFAMGQQFQLKITASGSNKLDVSQDSTQLTN